MAQGSPKIRHFSNEINRMRTFGAMEHALQTRQSTSSRSIYINN
jgi:hypothetical protein